MSESIEKFLRLPSNDAPTDTTSVLSGELALSLEKLSVDELLELKDFLGSTIKKRRQASEQPYDSHDNGVNP